MGLDVKYRPRRYGEVLGQDDTVRILRSFVFKGIGFHQSYLFHGPYGSGKTTLGRILARALLCSDPVEGEPCDKCLSCRALLEGGTVEGYVEVDAATHSGKDQIRKIVATIQFSTFSGTRRIYLFDECFAAETVLLTRAGFRTIQELVEEKYTGEVLSYDTDTQEQVWKPVTDWFDLGERDVVELVFDNGVELVVTTNQEFFTTNRGWVTAVELTDEDDVVDCDF